MQQGAKQPYDAIPYDSTKARQAIVEVVPAATDTLQSLAVKHGVTVRAICPLHHPLSRLKAWLS
jgi:LysM repeat protein